MVFSTRTFNFLFLLANAYVLANIGAVAQNGTPKNPSRKSRGDDHRALRPFDGRRNATGRLEENRPAVCRSWSLARPLGCLLRDTFLAVSGETASADLRRRTHLFPPAPSAYDTGALLADLQSPNDVEVSLRIHSFEVIQQATTPADHHQQPTAAGEVFLMRLEMFGEARQFSRSTRQLGSRVSRYRSLRGENRRSAPACAAWSWSCAIKRSYGAYGQLIPIRQPIYHSSRGLQSQNE